MPISDAGHLLHISSVCVICHNTWLLASALAPARAPAPAATTWLLVTTPATGLSNASAADIEAAMASISGIVSCFPLDKFDVDAAL